MGPTDGSFLENKTVGEIYLTLDYQAITYSRMFYWTYSGKFPGLVPGLIKKIKVVVISVKNLSFPSLIRSDNHRSRGTAIYITT